MKLNVGGIVPESVVDGPGIRFVVFAQGCIHNCFGCFNQELQPFQQNKIMTVSEIMTLIVQYESSGITFSGGDPFEQAPGFTELAKQCRQNGLSIWSYTGYTFEELLLKPTKLKLLKELDVLVDGKFVAEQKNIELKFRGSSNQRIIDVQKSLLQDKITVIL